MDDLIASAWKAEEALLTVSVRSDPDRLAELLAPDFYEIGQSGRRWGRHEIVAFIGSDTESISDITLTERESTPINPDTLLLSYRLEFGSKTSRRSSLWRWGDKSIQCFFHQGTSLPMP